MQTAAQWQQIRARAQALLARAGDFDESKHPRDERGRFSESGGGDGGKTDEISAFVPIGLGTPTDSDFAKAGIHEISYKDAAAVTKTLAESTGASLGKLRESRGGWTDPETNSYSSEPTLISDVKGGPGSITLTADAIAHVLNQKEVWVVRDGEGVPSARDLRLDIMPTSDVSAQQISDVARKVDPDLFSGFTETVDDQGRKGISILVKDGIAPWKSEPSSTIVKGYGQPIPVSINWSERDIRAMIKDVGEPLLPAPLAVEGGGAVRVILDKNNNLYVWDAGMAIHASIEHSLDLESKEQDIWTLEKGKIVGVTFDGHSGRLTPAEIIREVQQTPHGAAAISAKADVGLLRLVEALDKSGIDADILPTAVSINKRVAEDDKGHSASIEREAGLGAVAALDDYRARVIEAIKSGKAAPEFKVDLVKLARAYQLAEAAKVKFWPLGLEPVGNEAAGDEISLQQIWMTASFADFFDGEDERQAIEYMGEYWDQMTPDEQFRAAILAQVVCDYDESKHPRDEHGRWTEGGGDGGGIASGGGPPVVAFHGTIETVVDSIMKEGMHVTPKSHHFDGSVYAGERGESVFVTTNEQTAISYASNYAQSESWHQYKAVAPVVFKLAIPQDEWEKFKEDRFEPESRYTRAIPPEWIEGAFKVSGDPRLEGQGALSKIKSGASVTRAASDVEVYMVIFVGEPKTDAQKAAEHSSAVLREFDEALHPRDEHGKFTDSGSGSDIGGGVDALEHVGAGTFGETNPAGGAKASPGVSDKIVQAIEDHVKGMGGRASMEGSGDLAEWVMRTQRSDVLKLIDSSSGPWPLFLLHKGDKDKGIPTVWLLSWSAADNTSIHDHMDSEVGVSVARGQVGNRSYTIDKNYFEDAKSPGGLKAASQDSMVHNNSTITLTAPFIHEMWGHSKPGAKRDVSVHAYYPPLKRMHYFKKDAVGNLHYDGDWDEDRPPEHERGFGGRRRFCPCCIPISRMLKFEKDWDESKHPRDERGRFGEGGGGDDAAKEPTGGKGKHPGKGYTKGAYVDDNGVIQTKSVEDAARALGENRKVNLDQPKKVSTLLKKLGEVSKGMIAKGEKAPNYNLCNVSVSGTNLFCVDNVGIPRIVMPQMDDDQTKVFRKSLEEKGYEITKESVVAANLRATQNELIGAKVAGIAETLRKTGGEQRKRLIISADDYVLDGHHNWAAKVGIDSEDGILTNDTKFKVARVNIDIVTLLYEALKFTGGRGAKGVDDTSKKYPTTILADLVNEKMADPRWHEWKAIRARALKLLANLYK